MLHITNINQLLPAIQDKPEFVVIDKGNYKVVDYVYQTATSFDTAEAMECRGIKFDANGLILARPFRKFFNYGENNTLFPVNLPHVVLEKLDGSMIHPMMLEGDLRLMTRKGITDVSCKAERHFLWQHRYSEFMLAMIHDGYTAIFEYVGPDNRIVLRYEAPELVLLGLRHTITGDYLPYRNVAHLAQQFEVPVVQNIHNLVITKPDEFIKVARTLTEVEGYVVLFDNGHMVKVKADEYVTKHRALDDLGSKKKVVALCCQGFMDDVLPILGHEDQIELLNFNEQLQRQVEGVRQDIKTNVFIMEYNGWGRKEAAITLAPKLGPFASAFFKRLDGVDPRPAILKILERNPNLVEAKWRGQ